MPERFASVQRSRAFEQVVAQFRQLIETGRLQPGHRLPGERDLVRLLNIGRSTLREALRSLEALGILETRPGQGTFVRATGLAVTAVPDPPDTQRLVFEARLIVEPQLAALAAVRATAEDRAALARIMDEQAADVAAGGSGSDVDLAFHRAVNAAAGNVVLSRVVDDWTTALRTQRELAWRTPGRGAASLTQHQAILAAIQAQDPETAEQRMREHIDTMRQLALAAQAWSQGA